MEVVDTSANAGKDSNNAAAATPVEEPEEVGADSAEVLRLKELHESMVESYTRKSKRRKITFGAAERATDADTKLDSEIFAAFGDDDADADEDSEDDEDKKADNSSQIGWTIDVRKSNSRKM